MKPLAKTTVVTAQAMEFSTACTTTPLLLRPRPTTRVRPLTALAAIAMTPSVIGLRREVTVTIAADGLPLGNDVSRQRSSKHSRKVSVATRMTGRRLRHITRQGMTDARRGPLPPGRPLSFFIIALVSPLSLELRTFGLVSRPKSTKTRRLAATTLARPEVR